MKYSPCGLCFTRRSFCAFKPEIPTVPKLGKHDLKFNLFGHKAVKCKKKQNKNKCQQALLSDQPLVCWSLS